MSAELRSRLPDEIERRARARRDAFPEISAMYSCRSGLRPWIQEGGCPGRGSRLVAGRVARAGCGWARAGIVLVRRWR